MTWDEIEGNWLHFKGKLRHNWAKLTDEDITRINGRRDELAARLQERYGFARSEAEREIGAWIRCAAPRGSVATRYGKIANARAGKPRPFSTFGQVTTMTAPVAGTLSRLAMTSI